MSNRFHNKWHRKNHHTYGNITNPDASHDPIASPEQPFLGDFVLQGSLCAVAPASSYAAYFYSNFTALCAFAGYRAIQAKSFSFPGLDSIGIQVDSQNIAISAYAPNVAINAYSSQNAISASSLNRGAFIGGNNKGAQIIGGNMGIEVYSSKKAISAHGVEMGLEVYSRQRAISAYGSNIGLEVASPQVAISAYSPKIAIRAIASDKKYNVNGIRALDVNGFSYFDGDVTISGNLTAFGELTYLDTKVQITSSLYVRNTGTDTALTVIQTGPTNIANFYDDDRTAFFIEDGGNVGIGTDNPDANLHVVDIRNDSDPEIRIQARTNNSFDPTLRLIGTGSTSDGLTVRYDSNVGDVYINNGATPSNNIAYRISTGADTDSVVVFNTGNVGINATTPINAAKLNIAGDNTSSNIALSASASFVAGSFHSTNMALSATGNSVGASIRSPNLALRVTGPVEINNNPDPLTNYSVNINSTGSTGAVSIGNSTGNLTLNGNTGTLTTAGTLGITTGNTLNINTGTARPTNINTGSGNQTTTIGTAGTVDINGLVLTLDSTTSTSINTAAGTATTNIGTGATTGKITIGNPSLTGGLELDGSPIDINANSGNAYATNIGTGNNTGAVSIGNVTGSLTINGNTGTLTTAGTLGITTGNTLNINTGTARPTNINTGSGNQTTTIGTAGTVDINGLVLTLDSTTSTSINTAAGTATTNIGTGATTGKITIGNTSLTGGVEVDGSPININVDAGGYATNIGTGSTTGAVSIGNSTGNLTINGNAGTLTTAGTLGITTGNTLSINTGTGRATNINTGSNAAVSINTGTGNAATNIATSTNTSALGLGNTSGTTNINGSTINLNSGGSNNVAVGTATAGSVLTVNGPIATNFNQPTITGNAYTVLSTDSSLVISNGTTAVTLTLPTASTCTGRWLYIKNITACAVNSNASNVKPLATNVAGTAILTNTAGKFAALQSDGTNWVIMMAN